MIDALTLAAGVLLPWAAGSAVLHALLVRRGSSDPWLEAAYGHFVGIGLVMILLTAQDALGWRLAFAPVAVALGLTAVAGVAIARRAQPAVPTPTRSTGTVEPVPQSLRWFAVVAVALLAVRFGTLAVEVLLRPLFAWDAWSQWATKAKAWSGLRELVPFISYEDWIQRVPGFTDTAPNYPPTIPLLQTWMSLALGRWDDALINLPWLAAYVALGLGVFGQLRGLGAGTSWAAIATYLALSLPMLNVHVALAGYADLHLAAVYALAVLALARWEATGDRASLILLASVAYLLPLLKIPGIAWLGTLVAGLVVAASRAARLRVAAGAIPALALAAAVAYLMRPGRVGVLPAAEQQDIAQSLVQHLFAFGSWNLLWFLFPIALAVGWREVVARKATAAALACGFGILVWTFFFTKTGDWVVDYTTVNRALLHVAPAAVAFAVLVIASRARRPAYH